MQGRPEVQVISVTNDLDYAEFARNTLKSALTKRGITYAQLAERLSALGYTETETSLAQKVRRGTFQFGFFILCMRAVGVNRVSIDVPSTDAPTDLHV